jgi:SAM-dependent methyltransferase
MRGPETEKSHLHRTESGFYSKYMSGTGLDIGYRGSLATAEPVLHSAIGVDLDYPGYNGVILPFPNDSQDYVFASHILEHVPLPHIHEVLIEWYRVVKVGGHIVITVPHQYLYERRGYLPSRWNADHKQFYKAQTLIADIDNSLPINAWRLRHLIDNDRGYDYSIPPEKHAGGCYELECVIQKISPPAWSFK